MSDAVIRCGLHDRLRLRAAATRLDDLSGEAVLGIGLPRPSVDVVYVLSKPMQRE